MTQHIDYRALRLQEAENYARDFVPMIPARLAADLIETAAPEPGEFVVDVACGTGVVARLAAERVGPSGKVVGVDLVPEMLEIAAATTPTSSATIEWRQADAGSLPLPDESYDLALCQLGLMFFPDRSAAVGEMRRVLSAGGRLAVNVPGPMPRMFEIMGEALGRHINPELPGFLRGVFSPSESELRRLLDAAQLRDVTVESASKRLRLPPPNEFLWKYLKVTPIAALVFDADEERRQAVEEDVVSRSQDFVEAGNLTLDLTVVTATARK
ncbi:MAG TPA: class I SAM-dependent methyltransferase [Mycobacterium sp.]|nr:class I SAM-dependent methyltransferase [Mycobacterium sp.]